MLDKVNFYIILISVKGHFCLLIDMTYTKFKITFSKQPLISLANVPTTTLKRQLSRWQKKGLVIKLKKGLYILNEHDRKIHPSRIFLANALYSPSYISTEYALGYYGLIPEKVEDVTSVTTKNVKKFTNAFGVFMYQHIKTDLFFGFKEIQDENKLPVFIAEPEKAILDFIYLHQAEFKGKDKDVFEESFRLQNLEVLKRNKLLAYGKMYNNKTMLNVVEKLIEIIKEYA
jgi:predicted transcriptional regulator of viral defense system